MDFLFTYNGKKIIREQIVNKKAFQLNANHPFVNSLRYIVNKFEHVGGGGLGPCTEGEDLVRPCT